MKEIFKDIPGYEGIYQVSDLGRVKSLERKAWNGNGYRLIKERILKPSSNKNNGYLYVVLRKEENPKTFSIHKLVAVVFLNHIPNGHNIVVDHKDNDKANNRKDNLQIITQRKNTSKDKKNKTSKYTGVSWHKRRKKWLTHIRINGKVKHLGYFTNEEDAVGAYQEKLNN